MILLAFLLSITLFACSSGKVNKPQDAQETATQKDTENKVEPNEAQAIGISIGGLDFNSTPNNVMNILGNPTEVTTASGVSIYNYGEGQQKGVTIYFIEDKAFRFVIENGDLTAPNGIKVGDNIVHALRAYYIPQEVAALGINEDNTDGEIMQKIVERNNCEIYLSDDKSYSIKLFFDLPSGTINDITISQVKATDDTIRLKSSDFNASPKQIAEKFGYPDDIIIYEDYAFEFVYTEPPVYSPGIKFLKNSSISINRFSLLKNWVTPNNIKIGDSIHDVLDKTYIPDDLKILGITAAMNNEEITEILNAHNVSRISLELSTDYDMTVFLDKSRSVSSVYISKFDHPQYQIAKMDSTFAIPVYDKEAIATLDDLYISGCTIGSARQDVFQLLGSPQKTEVGYDEYTDKYQDCYIGNSEVDFLSVGDYENLSSGRAWYYYITDSTVIGPRGLCVGDKIEKVMEVFPGRDDIDFQSTNDDTSLYSNPDDPNDEADSATVHPSPYKAYTGAVHINVDWIYGITFEYEDGIITAMILSEMLD